MGNSCRSHQTFLAVLCRDTISLCCHLARPYCNTARLDPRTLEIRIATHLHPKDSSTARHGTSNRCLFVENQTFAFYVLYSIFFTGLLFGFFGTFGSYTVKKLNLNVDPVIDPIVAQLKEVKVTSLPVKRIAASRKELINSAK